MRRLSRLGLVLALLAGSGVAVSVDAQQCFVRSPYLSDVCGASESAYYGGSVQSVAAVKFGSSVYGIVGYNNNFKLFDITSVSQPTPIGSTVTPPWTYPEGTHSYLIVHLKKPGVVDGFNYAYMPLGSWGWDFAKLTPTPTYLQRGYDPGAPLGSHNKALMFRHAGNDSVYLVGSRIHKAAVDSGDASVYLYLIGNSSGTVSPETITYATMSGTRLPVGGASDPSPYNTFRLPSSSNVSAWAFAAGGRQYVLVKSGLAGAVIDVTNPALPQPAGWLGSGGYTHTSLFSGQWTVDQVTARLMVGAATQVHFYDLSSPASPSYEGSVAWTNQAGTSAAGIDVDGGLLSLAVGDWNGFIGVGDGTPFALDDQEPFTYNPRDCGAGEAVGGDTFVDIAVKEVNGKHLVLRGIYASADVVEVSPTCLSTTPRPNLSITRSSATGSPTCQGGDVRGFPFDNFVVQDASGGTYTTAQLRIRRTGAADQTLTFPAPGGQLTWTPQVPGTYQLDVLIYPGGYDSATSDPVTTKYVTICGDPKAGGAVTKVDSVACSGACSTWLQGQTLTLSALPPRSQGTPSGTPNIYEWFVVSPETSTQMTKAGGEPTLLLSERGTYHVLVLAKYAHAANDSLSDCEGLDLPGVTNWLGSYTGATLNNTYDSCTYVGTLDSEPFSTGSAVRVKQGGTEPQIYLRSDAIVAEFDYRVSDSPWAATFAWELLNATGQPVDTEQTTSGASCTNGCTTTWSFAGGSLAAGTYTLRVQGTASDGTDALVISPQPAAAKTFTVQDCTLPSAPSSPSPANGTTGITASTVDLTWGSAGGNPSATYDVYWDRSIIGPNYQLLCGDVPDSARTCAFPNLQAGTTYKWFVRAKNLCTTGDGFQSSTWSFTTKSSEPPPPPPPTCTAPVVTAMTISPPSPSVGAATTFTATIVGTVTSVVWTIKVSGSLPITLATLTGNPVQYTFASPGSFEVEVKAINDTCISNTMTRNLSVSTSCTQTAAPVPSIAWSPSGPKAGTTVQFAGSATNTPTSWSWNFGDPNGLPSQNMSTSQNPVHVYSVAGTYTVTLAATNCFGTSAPVTRQIVIQPDCAEPAPPVASIDWQEKNTFEFNGQVYNQPYVGQTVHLLGGGTNNPTSFNWYDFGDGGAATTQQNPTHVWKTPGLKNLRMKATNCAGTSEEAYAQVQVYSDSRPVLPTFDISGGGAQAMAPSDPGDPSDAFSTGTMLTFTASTGYSSGDPVVFKWDFGDGSAEVEGNPASHVYECRGTYKVTLRAGRYQIPGDTGSPVVWGTASANLDIDGQFCGPESVIATGAAKVPGFNGTSWRTDMHIFNPSESTTEVHLGILPAGQANPNPFEFGPYTLAPKATLILRDILGVFSNLPGVTQDYTKAAIRIMYDNDDDEPPVVMQRTYTDVVGGGTYGQFIPGVQVVREPPPSVVWLTGLRNNGLETGFRTNVGLTHLKGDVGDAKGITLTLLDASGAVRGTRTVDLAPYGFLQESLVNLFGASVETIGAASLKVQLPVGAQVLTYYSEVDNLTGDPFLVTSGAAPSGKVIVPGVARLAGEAGTLWRTDVQLTNTDDAAHSWELKFFPRGDVPVVSKALPIEPGQSVLVEDIVQWIYQPFAAPDASGVLCVLPLEANDRMPTTSARTYNLTPSGTYGQFIVPLDATRGAQAGSDFSRLYITGMSTEDVARTNFGFVNLGAATVNFDVYFYDRDGDLLNPAGAPYTFALGVNGWDQDKLENRFRNFFGEELPPNQEAISAVVIVKSGGPGFAYASVIDSITGDPMLIPGQIAP